MAHTFQAAGCAGCLGKDDRALRGPEAMTCVVHIDSFCHRASALHLYDKVPTNVGHYLKIED